MQIRKITKADQSHGRGIDNHYIPAGYGIYDEAGKLRGTMCGSNTSYMGSTQWNIYRIDENGHYRPVNYFYNGPKPFAHAKAWVLNNF